MIERLRSKTAIATIAAVIAALSVGGVALAQNSGSTGSSARCSEGRVHETSGHESTRARQPRG